MKKNLLIAILLLLYVSLAAQRPTSRRIIPDDLITLNKGIYLSLEEFLHNEPSIPYNFELIRDRSNYYDHSEEYSDYVLVYTDIMGYKVNINFNDVWGYYDGNGVYLSYMGKPFELMHLGAISILSYHQNYGKNFLAQALGLNKVGSGITPMEKSVDVLLHLKNDTIIVPTARNFRQLLADDAELYHDYKTDRKTDSIEKPIVYINRYNEKHPLLITEKGIELIDMLESSEL
jgi:hypothetical protein